MVAYIVFSDVQRQAERVGFKLLEPRPYDSKRGRYLVARGQEVMHRTDELADVAGWLAAWERYVVQGRGVQDARTQDARTQDARAN